MLLDTHDILFKNRYDILFKKPKILLSQLILSNFRRLQNNYLEFQKSFSEGKKKDSGQLRIHNFILVSLLF